MKRLLNCLTALLLAALVWSSCVWTSQYYRKPPPPTPVSEIYPALYVKLAAVYTGDMNGSIGAVVSKDVLAAAAQTFVNVPILLAHDHSDLNACVGRTISSKIMYDDVKKEHYLEVVAKIVDPSAVLKIKNGLYHSVSVSFAIEESVCSIDNLDPKECPHKMGYPYKVNGKFVIARAVLGKITGLEISFVNIPGSAGARILKFSPDVSALDTSK